MHAAYQGGYRAGLSVAHGSHVMVQCENGAANTIPPVQMDCALGKLTPQIISCSFSTSRKSREDDERANFITDEGNLTSSIEESECGPPSKELAMLIYKNEDVAEVTEASVSTDDHEHEHELEESYPSGTEISFNCITSISGERTTWKIICEDGRWIGRAHDCGKFICNFNFNKTKLLIYRWWREIVQYASCQRFMHFQEHGSARRQLLQRLGNQGELCWVSGADYDHLEVSWLVILGANCNTEIGR